MHFARNLRYALQQWARRPLLAALALLPLALAMAALTALFTVVNVGLLRPLPGIAAHPGLVEINRSEFSLDSQSWPDYRDLRAQAQTLEQVYAYSFALLSVRVGQASADNGFGMLVDDHYFAALGVRPALGRLLFARDMTYAGDVPAVVLAHATWQRRYGGDPTIVGRMLTINGAGYTVVGVAAPAFRGHIAGLSPEYFLPITRRAQLRPSEGDLYENRLAQWLLMGARLAPGRSLEEARAELATIGARLSAERSALGGEGAALRLDAAPLRPLPGPAMRAVLIFAGVLGLLVATLLLVACINVAGLTLARAEERRSELALRLSLGASRGQLTAMMLAESLLLALVASALGSALAWAALKLLLAVPLPVPIPLHFELAPDWRLLGFALALTLLTACACGLFPAWRAARSRLVGEVARFRPQRSQQLLAVLQVAATLVLLVGGGAILKATDQGEIADPGIKVDGVLTLELDLATAGYGDTNAQPTAQALLEAAGALPGVEAAALAAVVPLTLSSMSLGSIEGEGLPPEGIYPETNVVSPGFAELLGIPLRGRDFDAGDRADGPPVAIINRTLARQVFGERDPLGREFGYGDGDQRSRLTVVGVIEDSQTTRAGEPPRGYLLLPLAQRPMTGLSLLLRSPMAPGAAAAALAGVIARIDPNLPPPRVFRLSEQAAIALLPQRLASAVVGVLSAVGLVLVALGLYGLLTQFVHMRRREFGVRQALGAQPARVAREIGWRGLRLVLIGVLLALPLALLVLRLCAGVFVGVRAFDLPLLAAAAATLIVIAALSCLIPARRAARIGPAAALRYE
ncbi:MAG: ABC transporter permease [Xanthomonadales bacterium]|nr:hypothetical protein [Xanthomonadales bacterium]MCC6593547.1 ABC transporter permease [Xanthomonadales bacterium]MCE7930996.1 hypothetical protein [Xanthomonadales bacterium PRO6]